jgi:tetraspanin-18
LKSSINKYYAAREKDTVTLMWDYIMASMKCCGVDSYEDFRESKKWTEGNKSVPEACCILEGSEPSVFSSAVKKLKN